MLQRFPEEFGVWGPLGLGFWGVFEVSGFAVAVECLGLKVFGLLGFTGLVLSFCLEVVLPEPQGILNGSQWSPERPPWVSGV